MLCFPDPKFFELKPLEKEDIKKLILRAVTDSERGMGAYDVCMDEEAADFLAEAADGDASLHSML